MGHMDISKQIRRKDELHGASKKEDFKKGHRNLLPAFKKDGGSSGLPTDGRTAEPDACRTVSTFFRMFQSDISLDAERCAVFKKASDSGA